jgi:predicted transcriptional regulator of viral defense system
MKWDEFLRLTAKMTVFTTASLLAGDRSPESVRRQLDRWVRAGKVVMLRRGVYAVREPYAHRPLHPFVVANGLRKASYISLQSALNYHGLIPEDVPVVTSVTTRRPEAIETPVGRFTFRHVNKRLFFGFAEREVAPGQTVLLAGPEKALIDLLYLTPGSEDPNYLEELRLEWDVRFDAKVFQAAVERTGSRKLVCAARRLLDLRKKQEDYTVL